MAPTVLGVGPTVAGRGALLVPLPTGGLVADDIALLLAETENQVLPATAGYADVLGTPVAADTTGPTRLTVRWHRAADVETADVAVGDSGDHQIACIVGIRGAPTTGDPWLVTAADVELVSDTSVSIPGLTTLQDDCLVLVAFTTGTDVASTAAVSGWTNATLTGLTEYADNWTTQGAGGGFGVAAGVKTTAGTVAPTTATLIAGAAGFKTLFSMVLPAASAPAGTDHTRTITDPIGVTGTNSRQFIPGPPEQRHQILVTITPG